MKWKTKARVMRACSVMPLGDRLYMSLQRRFGRLSSDPMQRLPVVAEIAEWAMGAGHAISDRTVLEVGTGHKPIVPIGLFLLGAREVLTFDLHRRLNERLTHDAVLWIHGHREQAFAALGGGVATGAVADRLDFLVKRVASPRAMLEAAGIRYRAPADAARTGLKDRCIDLHVSVTVLEHVPPDGIIAIMREASRLLADDGAAIHFVDLSDHFAHQDDSISQINFLRFSEMDWHAWAGNEFAYCNRLRRRELLGLFEAAGLRVAEERSTIDEPSLETLAAGLPLDAAFRERPSEELCTTDVRVLLRKAGANE